MTFLDPSIVLEVRIVTLLLLFGVASYYDWVVREVSDSLWVVGGLVGVAMFLLGSSTSDPVVLGLYGLLGVFVLQHFIPWDERLAHRPWVVMLLELGLYVGVVLLAVWSYLVLNAAPGAPFYAAILSVVFARVLFETGVLYGGADAKALMMAGALLPIGPLPYLITLPASLQNPLLLDVPFAFNMLVDGALLTLGGPIAILLYNLSRGEHALPRSLHMYRIPTEELPRRFVWLKDPAPEPHPKEETTAEDIEIRQAQAKDLLAKGVDKVWVTPQLPFLIPLAIGAVAALLVGNVLLWLLASLP